MCNILRTEPTHYDPLQVNKHRVSETHFLLEIGNPSPSVIKGPVNVRSGREQIYSCFSIYVARWAGADEKSQ